MVDLEPGMYICAGSGEGIDYGVVQNQTERGWWVFWHGSCTATVVAADDPDLTIHKSLEQAAVRAGARYSEYAAEREARKHARREG